MAHVERFPTTAALMAGAAERVVSAAAQAIGASGRFAVALAGGSTPKGLYELLASPAYARRVDWSRVHLFWGDERCVPPDDPASNYRLTREALLDHVPIPDADVHRIRAEDAPARAAASYERELRHAFATPAGRPSLTVGRRFDLVLLGMGENGHTASLFPGLGAVREKERWVVGEYVPEMSQWRVTLTPPLLNAARRVAFLVVGAGKAPMLQRVLEGPSEPEALPAQAIVPVDGTLDWLVDTEAAARLSRSPLRGRHVCVDPDAT
jgi:6-phosphogluconolactonase